MQDASELLVFLKGRGIDVDRGSPFLLVGPEKFVFLGSHVEDHAFCWCQPTTAYVPHAGHTDLVVHHKELMG